MPEVMPTGMFFTKGVGKHKRNLQSFEEALRKAGIAQLNLVRVSSIFPPGCQILTRSQGLKRLRPGQIVHCVLAEARTDEPNRLQCAGIGLALPSDKDQYGYISEHHGFGMTQRKCADYVEDMAATMLGTTLGIDIDIEKAWDERRELYKSSNLIIRTRANVQTAEGDKNGLWTTVVAAAVFVY
ncbi:MAG: arginine decarboxylase, pyruvoyl-dependent [Planctomycetes bacterium]|nr:arginine decarboxylase, pyruvoyl-dependent [Planctomycetota bacterium]